jgi:hypothetical protein
MPPGLFVLGQLVGAAVFLSGVAVYQFRRPGAYAVVWPEVEAGRP